MALEQVYYYDRFGSFNPGGMLYALRRDVVVSQDYDEARVTDNADQMERSTHPRDGDPISLKPGSPSDERRLAGHVRLRPDKRPRPLVLRVNAGDCLKVVFTNLLSPGRDGEEHVIDPETGRTISIDSDEPATRSASIHVNGLELSGSVVSDGTNVGFNFSSLAAPGETRTYTWIAKQEGGYLLHSMAAPAGGEGDGGQLGLGLFGSINVEPQGSSWYRSQVTGDQLKSATTGTSAHGTPQINYGALDSQGVPILSMLKLSDAPDAAWELIHSDINAIIDPREQGENCGVITSPGSSCGVPFREFTVIFHDEITAIQAFHQLDDEQNPISALKDGMGINYGSAGLGAMVLANRAGVGPARNCTECKLEEFFLTSWAMGDPALVVERDENNRAVRALYPDDPSNVHHSYLGDAVRFRNLHAGPKETHVFHLHAHQWTQDWHDPNSVYLDSQTISPGASFTYEVHYGGSGNRNLTPGDSIFHCHLYPHFAQGMWELWRTHDVFEAGTRDRWLPDGEIAGGTPNPAVVPMPDIPLPPLPTSGFQGYPFYIAGIAGHRPPQAPLDIDPSAYAGDPAQTLMRHVVMAGERETGTTLFGKDTSGNPTDLERKYFDTSIPEADPMGQTNRVASRVREQNADPSLFSLAAKLTKAWIRKLPLDGTPEERTAMDFHHGIASNAVKIARSQFGVPETGYPTCLADGTCDTPQNRILFRVNGYAPKPGAPFADPCPQNFYVGRKDDNPNDQSKWMDLPPERRYRATYLQFDMPVNKHGWHDPQARIIALEQDAKAILDHTRAPEPFFFRANSGECVVFEATNLIPSNLNLDDFQVFTPTDTIGQHIHLVKFDVTSSDGSGNGWNYEDGTFSPDEIRERIIANNAFKGTAELKPLTHRLFRAGGPLAGDTRGQCPETLSADPKTAEEELAAHPWCGAQSTIQRWWADPLLNQDGHDRTIRTVFTHDHFGPSSHQQHGLYAALVVEPNGSAWQTLAGKPFGGQGENGQPIVGRPDGGPTSYAANIIEPTAPGRPPVSTREYNVAVADYSLLYTAPPHNKPINPPGRLDHDLPQMVFNSSLPRPEGISVSDPGSQLMNYRNEPVPLRVGRENSPGKWSLKPFNPSDGASIAACEASLRAVRDPRLNECQPEPGMEPNGEQYACTTRVLSTLCDRSDLANVFSSHAHAADDSEIRKRIVADNLPYDTRRIFLDQYLKRDCVDTPDHNCNEPAGIRRDGDPATPILAAKEGDDVNVRLIQGAQEENHIFFMNGMKWLAVPGSTNSGYRSAQHIGISEHFEFNVNIEDPSPQRTKDHLYGTTASDNLWDGQWGILRVVGADEPLPALAPLPSNGAVDRLVNVGQSNCDATLPRRFFQVEAWRLRDIASNGSLRYHERRNIHDPGAIIYVLASESLQQPAIGNAPRPPAQTVLTRNQSDLVLLKSGAKTPEPLILRARAGECIELELTNMLGADKEDLSNPAHWSWNMMPPITDGLNFNDVRTSRAVGLHAQLVAGNAVLNDGSAVGTNVSSLAYPCDASVSLEFCGSNASVTAPDGTYLWDNRATYRWYAGNWKKEPQDRKPTFTPVEFGVIGLQNLADVIKGSSHGTIGALIIEPQEAIWRTDCDILRGAATVDDASKRNCLNAAATVTTPSERPFREFVLLYQNDVSVHYRGEPLGNLRNGDDSEDSGQKAFNYRLEPFWSRLNANPSADPGSMMDYNFVNVLSSKPEHGHGDPSTPLFTAATGTPVRFRIAQPSGHPRNGSFAVSGHDWVNYPWAKDSTVQVVDPGPQNRVGVLNAVGPGRHDNLLLASAGGQQKLSGDYLYRTPMGFAFGGGQWGIMRVFNPSQCVSGLVLDKRTGRYQVCE
ncbi:multicopper oxidase domain-containing protein [Microvirga sp. M2]|uniref:multicopper oxidase domain-containing protein n=1 Tax=Microvirga sp. M2 TaxID=3073270 RepID=UPI0039C29E5C